MYVTARQGSDRRARRRSSAVPVHRRHLAGLHHSVAHQRRPASATRTRCGAPVVTPPGSTANRSLADTAVARTSCHNTSMLSACTHSDPVGAAYTHTHTPGSDAIQSWVCRRTSDTQAPSCLGERGAPRREVERLRTVRFSRPRFSCGELLGQALSASQASPGARQSQLLACARGCRRQRRCPSSALRGTLRGLAGITASRAPPGCARVPARAALHPGALGSFAQL